MCMKGYENCATDGVAYDIYIGQSISPDKPYTDLYLKNLRLMQLKAMAAITKLTHALLRALPPPVQLPNWFLFTPNP